MVAGLALPAWLVNSALPLPRVTEPALDPAVLINGAYGIGLALAAAALMFHRREASGKRLPSLLVSAALADSLAWLGFAAWLAGAEARVFYTLLTMAVAVLWLVRPGNEMHHRSITDSETRP